MIFLKYQADMKKSWGIIKHLVNKNQVQSYQTKFRLEDGRIINDKFDISKHFNYFFTNIGPHLAERIPKANIDPLSLWGKPWKKHTFYHLSQKR